eukprot:TRINITY_DN6483_c0_g3_i1.p1 TRINITY_DN6483_c0_g3~~TRINITY_DN6483_c0_g3_i1.p1  ORF type:complete len:510 (-),score=54.93 TRINITY_DN6483_c0_g3_i1:30-1559(-)
MIDIKTNFLVSKLNFYPKFIKFQSFQRKNTKRFEVISKIKKQSLEQSRLNFDEDNCIKELKQIYEFKTDNLMELFNQNSTKILGVQILTLLSTIQVLNLQNNLLENSMENLSIQRQKMLNSKKLIQMGVEKKIVECVKNRFLSMPTENRNLEFAILDSYRSLFGVIFLDEKTLFLQQIYEIYCDKQQIQLSQYFKKLQVFFTKKCNQQNVVNCDLLEFQLVQIFAEKITRGNKYYAQQIILTIILNFDDEGKRFAWLGDAVLNFYISSIFIQLKNKQNKIQIWDHVSRNKLTEIGKQMNLDKIIKIISKQSKQNINIEILGELVEAIIGAAFILKNGEINESCEWISNFWPTLNNKQNLQNNNQFQQQQKQNQFKNRNPLLNQIFQFQFSTIFNQPKNKEKTDFKNSINNFLQCLLSWAPLDLLGFYSKNLNINQRFKIDFEDRQDACKKIYTYFYFLSDVEKEQVLIKLINWSDKEVLLGVYLQVFEELFEYKNGDVKQVLIATVKNM